MSVTSEDFSWYEKIFTLKKFISKKKNHHYVYRGSELKRVTFWNQAFFVPHFEIFENEIEKNRE